MSPYLAIANLVDGTFAIVAIDPTKRSGNGCTAIVQSLHGTRDEAATALAEQQTARAALGTGGA